MGHLTLRNYLGLRATFLGDQQIRETIFLCVRLCFSTLDQHKKTVLKNSRGWSLVRLQVWTNL